MLVRKLVRDLARHPGQSLALMLIYILGVAAFSGVRTAYSGLTPATQELYRRLDLPDLVAKVVFAPDRIAEELSSIPGIETVEPRIGLETTAENHPGVTVRVLSLPAPREPRLGKTELVRGRFLSGNAGELLLAEGAANYHHLDLGDEVLLKAADGSRRPFLIVGIVRQPEYLSMIPPDGFMAMPRSYMVAFVPEVEARKLLGRNGGVTEFAISLVPGVDEASTIATLENRLRRFRVTITSSRNLASVRNVRVHLEAIGGIALVFPVFFLLTGALGGFILLSRIIRQERGLIGLLRATGYSPQAIAWHYLGYTLTLAVTGALLSEPLGLAIAHYVRNIFAADLGTPPGNALWNPALAGLGVILAGASGLLAGTMPALDAARTPPAEAMRLGPPATARSSDQLWLGRMSSVGLRMSLRDIMRYPLRTLMTAVGMAFAIGLALAPALILKEMNEIERRVQTVRRYDLRAVPRTLQTETWVKDLARLPGVERAEGMLELPIDLTIGTESIRTYVLGIDQNSLLMNLPTPPAGGAFLARGLPVGDGLLRLSGPLNQLKLTAAGSVDYPLARPVLVGLQDAQRLLELPAGLRRFLEEVLKTTLPGLEDPVTTALLQVEPGKRREVMATLTSLPSVARVDDRKVESEDLQRIFGLTRAFIGVIEGFALLLGFALLYNTVVVSALERRRELATLRVMGFQAGEVGGLFLLGVQFVALLGLVIGIPLGLLIARVAMSGFPDFLPEGINLHFDTVFWIVLGVVFTVSLVAWPVYRELKRLDLASVVRERE